MSSPRLGTIALVQERVNSALGGLASRRDEVKQRCRTVLQSKVGGLLRNSQPNSPRSVIAHATCNLTNQGCGSRSERVRNVQTCQNHLIFRIGAPGTPAAGTTTVQGGETLANRVSVSAAARAAGLGEDFSGHSGRIGMARRMVAAGAPTAAVQHQGRWKHGDMVARYTRGEALKWLT